MKTYYVITFFIALLIINGCKKEEAPQPIDLKNLFSDTTWIGEFKYAGLPKAEPFAIRFSKAGTFNWYELDGDYTGTYAIDNDAKTVKLTFSSGSNVTATVTNNSELTNFQYGAAYLWVINTLELRTTNTPELTGTTWIGKSEGTTINMNFKPLLKVDYGHPTSGFSNAAYLANRDCIRITPAANHKLFGVFNKNGNITGIEKFTSPGFPAITSYYKWEVTKQ
jgi:hypothetical protein